MFTPHASVIGRPGPDRVDHEGVNRQAQQWPRALERPRPRAEPPSPAGQPRRFPPKSPPPASAPCPPGRSGSGAFPPGLSVVQQAVGGTGLPQVPMHARARLVTDHGSGDLPGAFEASLRALGIRLICGSPHHPQTPGKLEHVSRDAQGAADLHRRSGLEVLCPLQRGSVTNALRPFCIRSLSGSNRGQASLPGDADRAEISRSV